MSDSENFSLNSSVFTKTTGCAQRTCNIQTRLGKRVPPHQAPISIRRPCLSDNSGNATQPLESIFLFHVSYRNIKNGLGHTRISWESVYSAMEIEEKDDDLAQPDNNNDNDTIYYNSDNNTRLNPEATANAEEDDDEL